MADLFKDLYSDDFFNVFTDTMALVLDDFHKEKFITDIYSSNWNELEFKARMHHVSDVLKTHLPSNFQQSVNHLQEIITSLKASGAYKSIKYADLVLIFIPDYIEKNGIDDFNISVKAFENITQSTSCEFAVRPFIIKYEDKMLDKMLSWTKHPSADVRRLASEGCRSRLPWGMALQAFKTDPSAVLPILEALKDDPSEYVRRSVANNLNDISKDNPQIVIAKAKQWLGQSDETDKLVKHACRTLLKAGNQEVLHLFGFASPDDMMINDFKLKKDTIRLGDHLEFSFQLHNESSKREKIRLEYGIYYMKQNGSLSKKVYKISEKEYAANSITTIMRRQSFKLISTRKFHAGEHILSLIVNGLELEERRFELDV